MTDSKEGRDIIKRRTMFVNSQALNSWLCFGTVLPPIEKSDHVLGQDNDLAARNPSGGKTTSNLR